jgi:GT2 family glycosyltransferase
MASMSHNVGVARAWNIGLAMSQTPVTFILNADLHVSEEVFTALERALNELPDAAVVGPQGSFFDFATTQDIQYFQRGSFPAPVNVDAVSGFLFGVRSNMFGPGGLQFENSFTPCYFEEWDLGLQCRLMGVKCYIVPTTAYDHEWSGSIRALRTIKYFRSEATSREILDRNRSIFLEKWKGIARNAGSAGFLDSLWTEYNAAQQTARTTPIVG